MWYSVSVGKKDKELLGSILDEMADGACYLYGAKFANYKKNKFYEMTLFKFDKERAYKMFQRMVKYAVEDYELEKSNPQEHVYARENYLMKLEDDACEQSYLNHESRML